MLREQVDCEEVFVDADVGVLLHRFEQGTLDFPTGGVLGVQDAVLRMPAFLSQAERPVRQAVKLRAVIDQLIDPAGPLFHHRPHDVFLAQPIPRIQRVGDVLFKGVHIGHDRGDAALCVLGVGFFFPCLRDDHDFPEAGGLEREGETCYARTDDEKVGPNVHQPCSLRRRLMMSAAVMPSASAVKLGTMR